MNRKTYCKNCKYFKNTRSGMTYGYTYIDYNCDNPKNIVMIDGYLESYW